MRYERGQDVARDDAEAAVWFRKAAAQKNPDSVLALANRLLTGPGGVDDWPEAAGWYGGALRQELGRLDVANAVTAGAVVLLIIVVIRIGRVLQRRRTASASKPVAVPASVPTVPAPKTASVSTTPVTARSVETKPMTPLPRTATLRTGTFATGRQPPPTALMTRPRSFFSRSA